jgi:F0F1-type ATP synthase membrane subunit a
VNGEMIPITMFIGLTIVLCLFFWFRAKTRSDVQATIRAAMEKGQDLSPEIIDRLGHPKPSKYKDLRAALIFIAIALSMGIFGFMVPDDDEEVALIFAGMASLPFLIGLAYLVMWRVAGRDS